ncbi:hypothetical protein Q7A53_00775 [Halobacillus rhizosphaerae]|uniref:hypothetical protein n=1 Tax=Halobacillus rhizosphaerae TaxID=3064889 RepID=UPI00398A7A35
MENKTGNIVIFPKWRTRLEKEGLQAVNEKRYQDAVASLQPLLEYGAASHDAITGLLMSWIELGYYEEAESLCKQQMKIEEDHYFEYLHIYITILFQDNRYQELVDLLDEVFNSEEVPHQNRTQLWQMYEVSRKLLEDTNKQVGEKLVHDFFKGMEEEDLHKQWRSVAQLHKQSADQYISMFKPILMKEAVHPIIKTAIIEWFRESKIEEAVTVFKFGKTAEVVPSELNLLQSEYIIKQIQMRLGAIEQSNPTMYEMLDQLLYHYCYVRYPLYPDENELPLVVEALKQLGHEYLQLPYSSKEDEEDVSLYKEEIELCEQHYLIIAGQ